jgi:hypothetical protein
VREESHLDEMREAIRGDFARLAERRGEQELMHVGESPDPVPALPAEEPETGTQRGSWLARLLSQ